MSDSPRVLVVDDDATIRDLLAAALTDEGIDVRTAAHGGEALAVLTHWPASVILLDLMMPVMDGPAFRALQLEREGFADIPVVVMTAAREAQAQAEALGADSYLAKPFDLDDVLAAIYHHTRPNQ